MKKTLRKIIPAIVMVLIAASMVGTSTFAWFSMNSKVTVTGMTVTTKVSDNLAIADTNHVDAPAVVDNQYTNLLNQTRTGELRPTSTVNGVNYFYTNPSNVQGNGDAKENIYVPYSEAVVADPSNALPNTDAGKTHYDAAFQEANLITGSITTTNVIYGYIDYTFYIKATNVGDSATNLILTTCNLLYNGVTVTEKAWRVAVFAHETTVNVNYDTAWTTDEVKALLRMDGSANFTTGEAVNTTTTTGTVTYKDTTPWAIDSIDAGSTEYNKVTVRLWLEGEDTTCNNETFATLTANYTLNLGFELGANTSSVQYLNSEFVGATATGATISVTLNGGRLTNNQTASSYQWYKVSTTTDPDTPVGTNSPSYTAVADGSYYCVVTTNHTVNNTYRTVTVAVTV